MLLQSHLLSSQRAGVGAVRGQLREMELQQLRERATLSADERAELHALREGLREASLVELEDRAVRHFLSLSLSLSLLLAFCRDFDRS